jgi:hypothetical protein
MLAGPAWVGPPGAVTKVNRGLGLRSARESLPIFRCPQHYCCGLTVPSQVEMVALLERTTASANEQK